MRRSKPLFLVPLVLALLILQLNILNVETAIANRSTVNLPVSSSSSLSNWEDYGRGFRFKHEPNYLSAIEAQNTLRHKILKRVQLLLTKNSGGGYNKFAELLQDPIRIHQPLQHTFSFGQMAFRNIQVEGLLDTMSVHNVQCDLVNLKVILGLRVQQIVVKGKYILKYSWMSGTQGLFTVTVSNITVNSNAHFIVDKQGYLQLDTMTMDPSFTSLKVQLDKKGFLAKLFETVVNSIGGFIFHGVKGYVWGRVLDELKVIVKEEARSISHAFPNSISPIDVAMANARVILRESGLDPMTLPNIPMTSEEYFLHSVLHDGVLHGLSSLERNGPILLGFQNQSVHITFHLGAKNLLASYNWTWGPFTGLMQLQLTSVSVQMHLEQNLDHVLMNATDPFYELNNDNDMGNKKQDTLPPSPPKVSGFQWHVGPMVFVSNGVVTPTLHYIIDFLFNISSNLLQQPIVKSIVNSSIHKIIQDEVSKVNFNELINAA